MAAITAGIFAVSAALGYASYKQQKKAANYEQQALIAQRKQSDLQAARQRRDAVKASRLAYATAQTAAANQGTTGTSGSIGGLGSIISQGNSNTSFLDAFNTLSDQAGVALGQAAIHKSKAAGYSFASDLAAATMNYVGSQQKSTESSVSAAAGAGG